MWANICFLLPMTIELHGNKFYAIWRLLLSVVYHIRIIVILILNASQMLIGQDLSDNSWTSDIVYLLVVIWFLQRVRNKMYPVQVLNYNLEQWHSYCVNKCGYVNFELELDITILIKLWCDNQATLHIVLN